VNLSRRRFIKLTTLSGAAAMTGGVHRVAAANALEVTLPTVVLPGEGPAFTVAVVADVHAPQSGIDFSDIVSAANSAEPDLVLIVGDSFNHRDDVGLVEMYAPLKSRLGKFATVGNWENWSLVRRSVLRDHYSRVGVELLDNQSVGIPELSINLVGLDERTNGRPDWSLATRALQGETTVVMHHSPGAFDILPAVDGGGSLFMLSGHTHGGQVAPLGRPLVLPPGSRGYISGLYGSGARQLYVTRGIGNSHFPVRIGARPELAIVAVNRVAA
jgi:predicted MPP superfamily phosphohydrolase